MQWAASVIDARQGERVLEIGSGHGVLLGLMADAGAEVTGLDRSASMTTAATRACGDRVALRTGRIQDAEGLGPFDIIAAMRVREVWTDPSALPVVERLLAPGGRVVLVLDSPAGPVPADTVDEVVAALASHGLAAEVVTESELTAVVARRQE